MIKSPPGLAISTASAMVSSTNWGGAVFNHVQQAHVALDGGLVADLLFSLPQVEVP